VHKHNNIHGHTCTWGIVCENERVNCEIDNRGSEQYQISRTKKGHHKFWRIKRNFSRENVL